MSVPKLSCCVSTRGLINEYLPVRLGGLRSSLLVGSAAASAAAVVEEEAVSAVALSSRWFVDASLFVVDDISFVRRLE